MAIGRLLAPLVFAVALVAGAPLKKEVLNLPPLIHFSDIFNTATDRVDDKFTEYTLNRPDPQQPGYSYPPNGGYPQTGYPQLVYPQQGYPQQGYPQPEYPQTSYPTFVYNPYPQTTYVNPPYPMYPALPQYPQYPPYPPSSKPSTYPLYPYRQQDVDIVERYWKFNDDGSKEYKLVMSNGLNIYQKVLTKAGDKDNIQFIEGYYSDRRDDNTFLNTYFSATNNGYSASSEISNSQPSYPDTSEMQSYPATLSQRKTRG